MVFSFSFVRLPLAFILSMQFRTFGLIISILLVTLFLMLYIKYALGLADRLWPKIPNKKVSYYIVQAFGQNMNLWGFLL